MTTCDYPLVSVIIPNYNHSKYLKIRINSVLSQDYSNFEVIILDDCSTDNSREIIESYRNDAHIVEVIYNTENSGNTFIQWQKGIERANGEYVWIAESDDMAESTFLSVMMKALLQHDYSVLAFSHSEIIDAEGNVLPNVWDNRSRYSNGGVYESRMFCLTRMLFYNAPYNASMVVFRKKYYYNVSQDYKRFRHNGDYLFWFEMCLQGKILEVDKPLNKFRQHNNKVSATGQEQAFLENAEIVDKMIDMLHLSSYQQRCLRGKYHKRWKRSHVSTKEEGKRLYPRIYGGTAVDVYVYTVDKLFNFSGMNR